MSLISTVREQFPTLNQKINNNPLVYLDSAATTLKPESVINRITNFYQNEVSNVHRGAHYLSHQATLNFEKARMDIQKFIQAEHNEEIIFTSGTTDGINLIAQSFSYNNFELDDEIVLTELEHHANLVPWQNLAILKKLKLKFIPVLENGLLDLTNLDKIITKKTKIVSFTGCSNTLGVFTDIEKIITKAQSVQAITVLDAAQLIGQKAVDVKKMNVDFLVFSMHKLFGPFGLGVLYGKKQLLNHMHPYRFGGSMISEVAYEYSTYNVLPFKFEAGTPNIEAAVATSAAIEFVNKIGWDQIFNHEQDLLKILTSELRKNKNIKILADVENKGPIISFNLDGAHSSDVGQILDNMGVAVRVGHHCTQPLLKKWGLNGTVRVSFSVYNNHYDIEQFLKSLDKAQRMLL